MKFLANVVTRHPWRVVLAWLGLIGAVVALTSPGGVVDRADVMETDQAAFLPDRYESARAAQLEQMGFPTPRGATASVVLNRDDGARLTRADIGRAGDLVRRVAQVDGIRAASADRSGLSPNGKVLLGPVLFDRAQFDPQVGRDVDRLRDESGRIFRGSGLTAGYAGETPSMVDAQEREGLTSQLTMLVILLLLVVLFRALVAAILDVMLVAVVGATATGLLFLGAHAFGFSLDTNVTGLLPIVVLGVGTDYVIFLLYRYRERLRGGDEPREAMRHAITRIGPAIGFSALTVVVSLSAMLLSDLASLRTLGPALGFGVLSTLAAALTLVPAIAVLLKRRLFWPSRIHASQALAREPSGAERLVAGRPVGAAVASALVLVALTVPALGFRADYDVEADVPGSPSAKAFAAMETGFPKGSLEPTKVMVRRDDGGRLTVRSVAPVAEALRSVKGVGDVRPVALSPDGRVARIDALLDRSPWSKKALDSVERSVRPAVAAATPAGMTTEVGGSTSAFADIRDAIGRDQKLIFPVAALMIALILTALLRSIAVPLFVMAGVTLGFTATLGATVLAFQGAAGDPGLVFTLPLVVYLFVASMVSDYSILVLSRMREEMAEGRTPRHAAGIALRTAGPSVVAAGLVLGASFGVLVISPSNAQVGFAIAVGILLSSVITARILVPALTVLAGGRAWWPGRVSRFPEQLPPDPELEAVAETRDPLLR